MPVYANVSIRCMLATRDVVCLLLADSWVRKIAACCFATLGVTGAACDAILNRYSKQAVRSNLFFINAVIILFVMLQN